ncbi:MAG: nucleotidyltransferase domain-containing protein [Elusimicrobia bacterium]|nr:nucleotidyltransferase domain-containing protein [Candidatus Liberimonas magnetica]
MEKKQYELCIEVLKRFNENGILANVILIGSWCLPFYKEYFKNTDYDLAFRTRDIDFLIPSPSRIRKNVDIAKLLEDMGFIINRSYPSGYMKFEHPDLIIEFLIPEKGKGSDKPFSLPKFSINAQPLRFLNILTENTITVEIEGIPVTLPNPIIFALHKLIISERRQKKEKAEKDKFMAIQILKALIQIGQKDKLKDLYISLPKKWQKMIQKALEEEKETEILAFLTK